MRDHRPSWRGSHARPSRSPLDRQSFTGRRCGFSLVLVLFLFMAFVAAYPLLFRQTESGFYRARTLYLWSRLQNAAESGLQLANSKRGEVFDSLTAKSGTEEFEYPLQANATFSITVSYECEAPVNDHVQLKATATSFVGSEKSGFDIIALVATVSRTAPASEYASWTYATFPPK